MRFFKEKELCCKCCGQLPPHIRENIEALVDNVLDPAREKLGKPIIVNSGYRCPKHNAEVGGVKNSQHMKGEAADIRPSSTSEAAARPLVACYQRDARKPSATSSGTDLARLAEIIEQNGKYDQLIIYPTFLHISWKRSGVNRRAKLWSR